MFLGAITTPYSRATGTRFKMHSATHWMPSARLTPGYAWCRPSSVDLDWLRFCVSLCPLVGRMFAGPHLGPGQHVTDAEHRRTSNHVAVYRGGCEGVAPNPRT